MGHTKSPGQSWNLTRPVTERFIKRREESQTCSRHNQDKSERMKWKIEVRMKRYKIN
jgi:hypothetical protein